MAAGLTVTQILARAREVLSESGYSEIPDPEHAAGAGASRVFEDRFGIVAIHAFETWSELAAHWNVAQGSLVDLISAHLRALEPKAWEGYLVLLTPAHLPPSEESIRNGIRTDTSRVRKLVATGDDLKTLADLRDVLLPLLPLTVSGVAGASQNILDSLPELLDPVGVSPDVSRVLVDSFMANESMLERLHAHRVAR